jgi:hypothetical protein
MNTQQRIQRIMAEKTQGNVMEATAGPPPADGFQIRIIEPTDLVSSYETRSFRSVEETEEPIRQLVEKFRYNGVGEYLIHTVNQSTGAVVHTLQRKIAQTGHVFRNGVEVEEGV